MEYNIILLITCDALRADAVQLINGSNTPNLNKLAKESIVFLNAFSNGPGTAQAFPAIMTSSYFLYHYGYNLNPKFRTLSEYLQQRGFVTIGFNTNPFLFGKFGYSRGFMKYFELFFQTKAIKEKRTLNRIRKILLEISPNKIKSAVFRKIKKIYWRLMRPEIPYLSADKLTNFVINCISNQKRKRLFMWVHYMDAHFPYAPPDEYLPEEFSSQLDALIFHYSLHRSFITKKDVIKLRKLYYGEVRFLDSQIGRLINYLEENNLKENSLIIVTADHGDAFLEHGFLGHEFYNLYNEVLRVPLIIYDGRNSGKINQPVFLIDILPTILSYLKIKHSRTIKGMDLKVYYENHQSEHIHRIAYADSAMLRRDTQRFDLNKPIISVINYPWKMIYNSVKNTYELYNIAKDPHERKNIIDSETDIADFLRRKLSEHILEAKLYRILRKLKRKKLKVH